MESDSIYRVVYAEDRGRPAVFSAENWWDVRDWAENSPVSHDELEVHDHWKASYVKLADFLQSLPVDNDAVNHPKHYTAYKGIEVIQLTEQMNFNRGNAVKYIARAGLKNPDTEVEDLEKALWYIQREIDRIKK